MGDKYHGAYQREGEVSLYELYLTLKKRLWLILVIFIAAVGVAGAVSYQMPPVYQVSASLMPGWLAFTEEGEAIYIDSVENISSQITAGAYNTRIIKAMGLDPSRYLDSMEFEVFVPRDSQVVNVYYEDEDPERGRRVMGELLSQVQLFYRDRQKVRVDELESSVELLRNKLSVLENKKSLIINKKEKMAGDIELQEKRLALLEKREKFLAGQLEKTEKNTDEIMSQRSEALEKGSGADAVAMLLYSNTIQQNIGRVEELDSQLQNNVLDQEKARNQLRKLKLQLKDEDIRLKDVNAEFENTLEEIKRLKLQMRKIEGIRVIQEPQVSTGPVKPKKALNMAVAGVFSLFFGVFLAVFWEWVGRNGASHAAGKTRNENNDSDSAYQDE